MEAFNANDENKRISILDDINTYVKTTITNLLVIKLHNGVFLRTPLFKYKYEFNTRKKYTEQNGKFSLPFFETKENMLYLYSFVPQSQLNNISLNGLDSKFGGIYWHNSYIHTDPNSFDMCKFFLDTTLNNVSNRSQDINDIIIRIVIPIEKSYDINLSAFFSFDGSNDDGYNNIFFVGIIEPKYIHTYDSQTQNYSGLTS